MSTIDLSQFTSLADFAAYNTDDVASLTSRLPEEGVFLCRGSKVELSEQKADSPEHDDLIKVLFEHEILAATPLNKELDPDAFIGRKIIDMNPLWPQDFAQALGLIKGSYSKIGLPTLGNPGGIPGVEGWLDGLVNFPYYVRVNHYVTRNKVERAGFQWKMADRAIFDGLGIPAPEKAK